MSVVYGIAFVAAMAFLIFLNVVKNRTSAELYAKLHPPKKEQEEFLKACELYLAYRNQPEEHLQPVMDAKYDAAVQIRTDGFLPAALESLPVRSTDKMKKPVDYKAIIRADGEPEYMTYKAIETVSRAAFLEAQKRDALLSGYAQDKRFWNQDCFNAEAWKQYCAERNEAFNRMVDRYLAEVEDGTEKGPGI
jgi:hypothetical protein